MGTAELRFVWHDAGGEGDFALPTAIRRTFMKDVDHDGHDELVLVASPPTEGTAYGLYVIGVEPKAKRPARMTTIELRVLGANDEASLERELALATLGPPVGPPERLIARLPLATPDELRALVGPAGLKTCNRLAEKIRCTTIAQKQIDGAKVRVIVGHTLPLNAFEPAGVEPRETLDAPSCTPSEKDPKLLGCDASVGGPEGGQWYFEKTASSLRLAEVWQWAETS